MSTLVALVAFDLAGVVCRFDAEHRLAVLGEAAGLAPEVVQERIWDAGIDAAGDLGELSADEMCDAVRGALGLAVDNAQLRGLYVSAFAPDPAVLAVVDRVRLHAPTALLTNNGPLVLEAMEHELAGIGRRFDPWGFACRYGVEKPDPAIFHALCDEAGVAPEAVFFVDDSEGHVAAAQKLGIRTHHFTDADRLADALLRLWKPTAPTPMTQLLDDTSVRTSVEVKLTPSRAFHLFTAEIGAWWNADQHILQAPLAEMEFEPFVGGHIIDRSTDGSECRWARVLAYDPPHRVVFSWDINVQWQLETDPDRCSEVEITFTESTAESTRVQLTHRHLDRHGPGWETMRDHVAGGWSLDGFAAFADGNI